MVVGCHDVNEDEERAINFGVSVDIMVVGCGDVNVDEERAINPVLFAISHTIFLYLPKIIPMEQKVQPMQFIVKEVNGITLIRQDT